jgi:hypothetical protein
MRSFPASSGLICALLIAAGVLGVVRVEAYTVEHQHPFPLVSFTYHGIDDDGAFIMPPNVDFWTAEQSVDEHGISYFKSKDGKPLYNVSTVAFQAMASQSSYPELNLDTLVGDKTELSERQKKAFEWLADNSIELPNGSRTWHYNFPLNYNNMLITSSWPSAFAQAAVIHAYLVAHRISADRAWLDDAKKAALAFELPADRGGLSSWLQGLPFFEEVPLPEGKSPHILNGHLYSVVILGKLFEATRDSRIGALYEKGNTLAQRLLLKFDQGYWTRYDLRPRFYDVPFQLTPSRDAETIIERIAIRAPNGTEIGLDLTAKNKRAGKGKAVYGPGWGKTTRTGTRLSSVGSFSQIYLPTESLDDYLGNDRYVVDIIYEGRRDAPPTLAILGFRQDVREYYELPIAEVRARGTQYLARYNLEMHDLQWSYLQEYYVDWHSRLMEELASMTGDHFYYVTALRWQNYIENYRGAQADQRQRLAHAIDAALHTGQSIQAARQDTLLPAIPPIRKRIFEPTLDPYLDREIVRALGNRPISVLDDKSTAMALLRYVYFRMKLGTNPYNMSRAILEHGEGSCLHYSTVYADLTRRAGLETRLWNIYEVPEIGGHNTTEVKIDGKWAIMDPAYGLFFTDEQGQWLSVAEVVAQQGKDMRVMGVSERGALHRGEAPPSPAGQIEDLFVEIKAGRLPEFSPSEVFTTGKLGVQGPDLVYMSDWTLVPGHQVGDATWSGTSKMWTDMMRLRKGNRIVSLHELGQTRLHEQQQRYALERLKPGEKYVFEVGLGYTSHKALRLIAWVDNHTNRSSTFTHDELAYGYFKTPQLVQLTFEATNESHIVHLRGVGGYALLNYVALKSYREHNAPPDSHNINAKHFVTLDVATNTARHGLAPVVSQAAKVVANTPFYEGHGPENAFDGDPYDDFVAAREGTMPNSFMFDVGRPVVPSKVEIIWNSALEYATEFSLYGIDDRGDETELLYVTGNKPVNVRENSYDLNVSQIYTRYRFVIREAAGQNRLLLLQFRLRGQPAE